MRLTRCGLFCGGGSLGAAWVVRCAGLVRCATIRACTPVRGCFRPLRLAEILARVAADSRCLGDGGFQAGRDLRPRGGR